jgi:phage terminase Nu1 subunit (DNA packaging protein)
MRIYGEFMSNTTRWNIAVSQETDRAVRLFLASQGGGRKGDLSRFIEESVRAHILELTAEQAKAANVSIREDDLSVIVAEAVEWARDH